MTERLEVTDLIAYIPVVHKGYLDMIEAHPEADIGILNREVLKDFPHLRKDIHALEHEETVELLSGYYQERFVRSIGKLALKETLRNHAKCVVLPDDEISRQLLRSNIPVEAEIETYPVFLRWDRENTTALVEIENTNSVSVNELEPAVLELLVQEAEAATNMWRRVGAVLVKNGAIVESAHNESLPTSYSQALEGDPRNTLHRGVGIEFSNDHHAEARIIANMARRGESTEHTSIFVTDFPCPVCAKDIAAAGINKLYFVRGYAVLDGQEILRAGGTEIIQIQDFPERGRSTPEWRQYPPSRQD